MRHLRALRYLELLAFPTDIDGEESSNNPLCGCETFHGCDNDYEMRFSGVAQLIEQVANKIFKTLGPDCPWFIALLINSFDGMNYEIDPHAFLRLKQIDVYGQITYAGRSVDEAELKHHEPCAEHIKGY